MATWSSRFPGAAQRSSRAVLLFKNSRSSSSYPEGNFGGNQLLDGSISLSPYTQVRRTICTSVSLRASTRVSSGFAPLRHSSPSFGSRQVCSLEPSQKIKVGRRCTLGGDRAGQLPYALRVCSPVDSHMSDSLVRVSRRVEWGAAGQRRERAVAEARRGRALSATIGATAFRGHIDCRALAAASIRAGPRPSRSADRLSPFHIRPGRIAGPIRFLRHFKHSLTLFSKSFSSFLAVLVRYRSLAVFSLGRNLPPIGAAFQTTDSPTALVVRQGPGTTGLSPLRRPFQGTWAGPPLRTLLQTTIRTAKPPILKLGCSRFARPGDPPDLGSRSEALAPLGPTTRVERSTTTGRDERRRGIAFGPTRAGAHGRPMSAPTRRAGGDAMRDAQADVPWPNGFGRNLRSKTRWFTGFCNSHQVSHFATFFIDARAEISVAESRFDIRETSLRRAPADGATVRRTLRSVFLGACRAGGSLARTSSAFARAGGGGDRTGAFARAGPRFYLQRVRGSPTETLLRLLLPLNDKVQWTSRDVAGSEPPTSPRSEHFTGPFNR
ncbi:UNVERIFIED_CONTAM: hypothetical protein Sindi_3089100 [Sesamum indicum]